MHERTAANVCDSNDLSSPLCGRGDGIHHLYDAVEGGVCPDGHVCATEVIVDRTHHAYDVQVGRFTGLVICNFTWRATMVT